MLQHKVLLDFYASKASTFEGQDRWLPPSPTRLHALLSPVKPRRGSLNGRCSRGLPTGSAQLGRAEAPGKLVARMASRCRSSLSHQSSV
jgi:hypothetical protein